MLKILYQDPAIVVCEKPFRVLSTDEPGGCLTSSAKPWASREAEVRTVHRLDQVVGGLMVYALTPQAASDLSRQIREDRFLKEYLAVIHWRPWEEEGTFLDLLGPQPQDPKDLRGQTPRQGHPAGRPPLPGGGQPPGGSPWCPSGWRPGGPIRSGPSSLPGASPGGGDRKYSKYPRSPGVADRPVVPPPWPLPTRRPARPWISVWIPLGEGAWALFSHP